MVANFTNPCIFKEVISGQTPENGFLFVYPKENGILYYKNDSGVEIDLSKGQETYTTVYNNSASWVSSPVTSLNISSIAGLGNNVTNSLTLNMPNSGSLAVLTSNTFSGVQRFITGSAAIPSTNYGNSGTGIYSNGTNQLALTFNGIMRWWWDQNGILYNSGAPLVMNSNYAVIPYIYNRTNDLTLIMGTSDDLKSGRESAGVWAQRNGTNAQAWRIYNSYTSNNVYNRFSIDWQKTSNTCVIGTSASGSVAGNILFHIGASDIAIMNDTGILSCKNLIYDGTGNSLLWNNVYTTVYDNSANWQNVYNTFMSSGVISVNNVATFKNTISSTAGTLVVSKSANSTSASFDIYANTGSSGYPSTNDKWFSWSATINSSKTELLKLYARDATTYVLGGVNSFAIQPAGLFPLAAGGNIDINTATLRFSQAGNQYVDISKAGTIPLIIAPTQNQVRFGNNTSPQSINLINTYTSTTNFEGAIFSWANNTFSIATSGGGSGGTLRGIDLKIGNNTAVSIASSNNNISFFTSQQNYGGGSQIMFITNSTNSPLDNPSGGGYLFVSAGELKYKGSAGTVTTIAPA